MARHKFEEKVLKHFSGQEVEFTASEQEEADRLLFMMELRLKELSLTDLDFYERVRYTYDLSWTQCLRDLSLVDRIVANQKNVGGDAKKCWVRYWITQNLLKAMEIAQNADNKKPSDIARIADTMGKYHLADKEDVEEKPYDKIVPLPLLFSNDPNILPNYKPIAPELRAKLEKEFGLYKPDYKDAEIVENGTIPEDIS